jgi:hypothetical protein
MLTDSPEIKTIVKGIKSGEVTLTNALLSTLYTIMVDYVSPQRCRRFLEGVMNTTEGVLFCSECGQPKIRSTLTPVFGFDLICPECMSEYYTTDGNGSIQHRLDYNPNSLPSRIDGLHSYDSRRAEELGVLHTAQEQKQIDRLGYNNLPYLGIELECEARSNCPGDTIARSVRDALSGLVICKHDGSLHNGMEIVSRPATFAAHKDGIWEPFFQENDGPAQYLRAWRTDTAGTHIHISRAAFTPVHMAKFLLFINSSENGTFVEKFAGRSGDRWARRSNKTPGDVFRGSPKYEAVNFSSSAPTMEVRIFRGNISKHGVYRNLEFVQALYEFTKVTSIRQLKYTDFCKWLDSVVARKTFPYLYNWCIFNDYIRGKPVASIIENTTRGI